VPDAKDRILGLLQQLYERGLLERVAGSLVFLDRDERKARLALIVELSSELGRIRAIDIQATGLAEGAIEAVIEGDWRPAESYVPILTFQNERDPYRSEMAVRFASFNAILMAAVGRVKGHAILVAEVGPERAREIEKASRQ